MIRLSITTAVIEQSVTLLKGSHDIEMVILWLGSRTDDMFFADEVYVPIQVAKYNYFEIPAEGMDQLMQKIKASGKILVAQVHTHPMTAFHSPADDKWAILRHLNAYSIVIPYFCQHTNAADFLNDAVSFILSEKNRWIEVDNSNLIIV